MKDDLMDGGSLMVTITLDEYRELLISNVGKDHKISQLENSNLTLTRENTILRSNTIKAHKKEEN